MTRKFAVVFEAPADFVTASELADRVLQDAIAWLTPELLPYQRAWLSEAPPGASLTWKSLPEIARAAGIRVHGHFDGAPGAADARAARRAIAYVLRHDSTVDAILLIRDADNQPERRLGLEQASSVFAADCTIVIGLADRMRECWVICGFQPGDPEEVALLAAAKASLQFDPTTFSHRLTARDESLPTSPKRVLRELTRGDLDRQRNCWQETPLDVLVDRGRMNGLAEYLNDVRARLVPLIRRDAGS